MRKLIVVTGFLTAMYLPGSALWAADTAPKRTEPTLEQRVSDLEAYMNNGARGADSTNNLSSKLGSYDDKSNTFTPNPGPGANAWQMTSAALVLFMTLPGLALFYGGLVRRKNVLSVMAQCFFITGMVTIITPALIIGAIAERMKFSAICLFMTLWMFIVYFPQAHMIWGIDGFMNGVFNKDAGIHAIDFAGGTVVHMTSGWSALVLCLILGKRLGFGRENMAPHSMVLCMVGTGMLWVGWYGFNAGSAVGADGVAANAFTTTTIATAVASFVWPLAEWIARGKPSVLGFCSGAVAGLVVITPACGFVDASGALWIGVAAGIIPWFF